LSVKENYQSLLDALKETCRSMGRDPKKVHVLPVSKTFSEEKIWELCDYGVKAFGENRVQEIL